RRPCRGPWPTGWAEASRPRGLGFPRRPLLIGQCRQTRAIRRRGLSTRVPTPEPMTMQTDQDDVLPPRPGTDAATDTDTDQLVEQLRGELEQLRAQALVERADLENQRKRMERDARNACRFANKQLLGDLLPVFDSLEAALANAPDADPLRDGVVLILRELSRVAGNNGLVEIAPEPGDC